MKDDLKTKVDKTLQNLTDLKKESQTPQEKGATQAVESSFRQVLAARRLTQVAEPPKQMVEGPEQIVPQEKFVLRLGQKPELYLRLYQRPFTFLERFRRRILGTPDSSTNNFEVLQAAWAVLAAKTKPDPLTFSLIEEPLRQLAASQGPALQANFFLSRDEDKDKRGFLFRLLTSPQTGKLGFSRVEEPGPGLRLPGLPWQNFVKNALSRGQILLSQFFANQNLAWLRVSLGGALGLGSLVLPVSAPLRVALAGGGGLMAAPDIIRSGGNMILPALRLGARGVAGAAALPQMIGLGAFGLVLLLILLALPVGLIFLNEQKNKSTTAAFLKPAPNPFRYISPLPPSAIEPTSADLMELFNQAGLAQCVPVPMLLSTARVEAGGIFSYTNQEVENFTTARWWVGASPAELERGYCYDTCDRLFCAEGANVMGPMQFEERTWNGLVSEIKRVLQESFGLSTGYTPDRCNLRDAIVGAAIKLKANSGTNPNQCTDWNETQVAYSAFRYCGSCGTQGCSVYNFQGDSCSRACGVNYCGNVWSLYQAYSK